MKERFEVTGELFKLSAYAEEGGEKLFVDVERTHDTKVPIALDLIDALKTEVKESMIDRDVIREIIRQLRDLKKVQRRRVAKGYPPKAGREGKLVFLKRKFDRKPHFNEQETSDSINLSDLSLFENVLVGDEIARIYPPLPGVDGLNAFGDPVPALLGNPVDIECDKDTVRTEPKDDRGTLSLFTLVDGYCELQGKTVRVREELVVNSDLDNEFGALDFVGSIRVLGDVLPGFHVKAEKSVTIKGNVNRAQLRANQGDVTVAGFYFGEGEGEVLSPGNFSVRGIHHATVEVGGDFIVKQEIHHSEVRVGGVFLAPKASLIGGKTFLSKGLLIGELGSSEDIDTHVNVGSAWEMSREASLLLGQLAQHQKVVALLEAHLGPLRETPGRIQGLPGKLKEKMGKLYSKYESVLKSRESLQEKIDEAKAQQAEQGEVIISFSKAVHPGVEIVGRDEKFRVIETMNGPGSIRFDFSTNTFEVGEYVEEEGIRNGQTANESGDSGPLQGG